MRILQLEATFMKNRISLSAASLFAAGVLLSQTSGSTPFLEKPYLQLGDAPNLSASESLVLMWHTANTPSDWKVELRTSKDSTWRAAGQPKAQVISAPAGEPAVAGKDGAKKDAPASAAIDAHLVYRASLTGLAPGEDFRYRVLQAGKPVFEASARARKPAGQPFRFVLFGDCGQGTPSENAVAYQAYLAKPDFVFIPGDIVYSSGRISEYRDRFYPTYNADEPGATIGAPLLRSLHCCAGQSRHRAEQLQPLPRCVSILPLLGPTTQRPVNSVRDGESHSRPYRLGRCTARLSKGRRRPVSTNGELLFQLWQ
jgi:hypothetical protein